MSGFNSGFPQRDFGDQVVFLDLRGGDVNEVVPAGAPDMPSNELGIQNGSVLTPTLDLPSLDLRKGEQITLSFDGEYVRNGGLTWSPDQLTDEIKAGYWTLRNPD